MSASMCDPKIGDLADMTDEAFAQALERGKTAELRAGRILREILIENAHYGNPKGVDGQPMYPHPILYLGGAEKLIKSFRLSLFAIAPDRETEVLAPARDFTGSIIDPGYVSVTVYRGISVPNGVVSEHASNCNSREPRFEGADNDRWRYEDAREVLNECIAIARKRCKVHLVCDVLGLRPWLHTEEEMLAAFVPANQVLRP